MTKLLIGETRFWRTCESCQLLILDELGPLEFKRGAGLTNGIGLITARGYQTGLRCRTTSPCWMMPRYFGLGGRHSSSLIATHPRSPQ